MPRSSDAHPLTPARLLILSLDALRRQAHLLDTRGQALLQSAAALDTPVQDLLWRLLQRRVRVIPAARLPQAPVSTELITRACDSGWLEEVQLRDDILAVCDGLSAADCGGRDKSQAVAALVDDPQRVARVQAAHGPFLRLSAAAQLLVEALPSLARGDWQAEPGDLVRVGMGQLRVPGGTPLAASLAGTAPPLDPAPPADSQELQALLAARRLRETGITPEQLDELLATCAAWRGAPVPLVGYRFTVPAQLAGLLWDLREQLHLEDERRDAILDLLDELPLGPSLSRRVARERWRQGDHLQRRNHSRHYATWRIWNSGEARRWRLRATGKRQPRAEQVWPVQRIAAWLDHDHRGGVVAEGERVEAHALRRLAADGWDGLHCEGAVWAALALVLGWPVISAPVPGLWWGALQTLPGDWAAWGFASRRAGALARLRGAIQADPLQALADGWAALALPEDGSACQLLDVGPIPERALLERLCTRLPARAVAAIVSRLLHRPQERSGLPDLLVWRGRELHLWEVKSPGDSLSDQQWQWLEWLRLEDIPAGILRVDARRSRQLSLLDELAAGSRPAAAGTGSTARRRRPRAAATPAAQRQPRQRPAQRLQALLLPDRRLLGLGLRRPLPDDAAVLPADPEQHLDTAAGLLSGQDSHNQARCTSLPIRGFAWQSRGRSIWYLVPSGLHLLLASRREADPDGGLRPTARILLRGAGWLCPADRHQAEPVLVDAATAAALTGSPLADHLHDLHRPPLVDPCRVDDCAAAWGLQDAFDQQTALIAAHAHALAADPDSRRIEVHLAPEAPVLWLGLPGLERVDADWLS